MKEIKVSSIEKAREESIEAVCLLEKHFPSSIMTIQVHLLVHIVDEVAIAGSVHSRWMFFLERFMKTLKGFVRQRARPEGSMAEGWLAQESFVYISDFLTSIDPSMAPILDNAEDERLVGEVAQGKGTIRRMDHTLRVKINQFCLLNCNEMQKWVQRYKDAKLQRSEERKHFRHRHRTLAYPPELAMLPKDIDCEWLEKAITNAVQNGENVTIREHEFARGCDYHVNFSSFRHLFFVFVCLYSFILVYICMSLILIVSCCSINNIPRFGHKDDTFE